jgi:hypothetical protein
MSRCLCLSVLFAAWAALADTNSRATSPVSSTATAGTKRDAFFRAQPSPAGEFRAAWIHSAYGIEGWD